MYLQGTFLNLALRIQVIVKATARQPPAQHFHRAYLDNSMSEPGLQASSFSVDKNLPHYALLIKVKRLGAPGFFFTFLEITVIR
jgi:hypothetical protein